MGESKPTLPDQGIRVQDIVSHFAKNKEVFLAHIFEEEELAGKLKAVIEEHDYNWKEGKRDDIGSISEDILSKIKDCGFFIALMTKKDELKAGKFTTSSWLIEEKGAALAFGHRPLIMVEEGVDRHYVGFLQSDDQMIYFNRSHFDTKAVEAIKMVINTYNKHSGGAFQKIPNLKNTVKKGGETAEETRFLRCFEELEEDHLKVLKLLDSNAEGIQFPSLQHQLEKMPRDRVRDLLFHLSGLGLVDTVRSDGILSLTQSGQRFMQFIVNQ